MAKGIDRALRVGIVGAGRNTRLHHIPKLRAVSGVEVVAVANRSRESGQRAAQELGIPRVYDDWMQLVAADDIDAVCIGTWPYLHCPITLAALEHDKHVLCEARMAMNAAEAHAMLDAARQHPHLVTQLVPAPHTLELDGTIERLQTEGYLGELLAVELHVGQGGFVDREAPFHWRHDADLSGLNVMSLGIWYEALMRWAGPASAVLALTRTWVPWRRDGGGTRRAVGAPDHVELLLALAGGATAHLRVSAVTGLGPPTEAWLFGSEGTLRIDAGALTLSGGRRGDAGLRELPVPAESRIGWRVEEEFVNAVRGTERIRRTTFEDGVRYMEFTEAVTRSAQSGQAVCLPL